MPICLGELPGGIHHAELHRLRRIYIAHARNDDEAGGKAEEGNVPREGRVPFPFEERQHFLQEAPVVQPLPFLPRGKFPVRLLQEQRSVVHAVSHLGHIQRVMVVRGVRERPGAVQRGEAFDARPSLHRLRECPLHGHGERGMGAEPHTEFAGAPVHEQADRHRVALAEGAVEEGNLVIPVRPHRLDERPKSVPPQGLVGNPRRRRLPGNQPVIHIAFKDFRNRLHHGLLYGVAGGHAVGAAKHHHEFQRQPFHVALRKIREGNDGNLAVVRSGAAKISRPRLIVREPQPLKGILCEPVFARGRFIDGHALLVGRVGKAVGLF